MGATIALAGNPNSGKTTLFNALTGARQHVGNYPGVTVEKKEGFYKKEGHNVHIVDLPGTYSLTAYSQEEIVARNFIIDEKPGVIVNIVDASNLERNLYLTLQFLEMGIPVCIALNMMDVAEKRGLTINAEKLSELLGTPVIPTVARNGMGKKELMDAAVNSVIKKGMEPLQISYGTDIDEALISMVREIKTNHFLTDQYQPRWVALKYLENDEQIVSAGRKTDPVLSEKLCQMVEKVASHLNDSLSTWPEAVIADQRYGYIRTLVRKGIIQYPDNRYRLEFSDHMDKILTHRFFGPVIMLAVLMTLYQFIFTYSEIPIAWVESLFGWFADLARTYIPDGLLQSLIISGVIDGVGGVLGFVPLIMFMFFGISFLEDTGYLARVAFMLDRVFRIFGLHGSSVMAFIVSGGIAGGCAVPGIMATRTLKSPRERLATLLTVPFMNCGAKLPVFILLTAAFFANHEAAVMFGITIFSWIGALLVAKFLRLTVIKGESTPFVMELPPYRLPTVKGICIHTWERTWQYLKKAGTVILGISIVLWAMMTFPGLPESQIVKFDRQREGLKAEFSSSAAMELENAANDKKLSENALVLKKSLSEIDRTESETVLRYSLAGRIGSRMEFFSKWAGFDWRTNIALVSGFAAKEVVVSTLGTIYSLGEVDPEESGSLSQKLASAPGWSPLVALSLIVFTIFYAPCFVSVVCIAKEAGSWKWGAFSVAFNTILAFTLAVLVFQIGTALGY
ncbi:ferrous iron transport protein B [Desulfobacterales bacterium HSG16]|nr:ferrous iron transport protein B [Desulfobacterales bacterium HSG16]